MSVVIKSAKDHLNDIVELFKEYKQSLSIDMSFQPSDDTVEEICNRYKEPLGKVFIALVDGKAAGCIAFHEMDNQSDCELKRLYVRPEFRGLKLGELLLQHSIDEAWKIGYHSIYLDTLNSLKAACYLYEKFGFIKIEPYYFNPLPDVCYYRLVNKN